MFNEAKISLQDATAKTAPTPECLAERWPELVAMLVRMMFAPDVAEDAAQEAVICGLHAIQSGKATTLKNRRAWLRSVAIRRARRIRSRTLRCDLTALQTVSRPPPEEVSDRDEISWLRKAVSGLPEVLRTIVVYCEVEEHTYAEASSLFRVSVSTVNRRLHQARGLLQQRLRVSGVGEASR